MRKGISSQNIAEQQGCEKKQEPSNFIAKISGGNPIYEIFYQRMDEIETESHTP